METLIEYDSSKPLYERVNQLLYTEYQSDEEINWQEIACEFELSDFFIEEFIDYLEIDCLQVSGFYTDSQIKYIKELKLK